MKPYNLLILFLFLVLFCFPVNSQNAAEYLKGLSTEFDKISELSSDYMRYSAYTKNLKQIDYQRKDILNANRVLSSKLKILPPFNGDAGLRDSMLKYLEIQDAVLNAYFPKIVSLEAISQKSFNAMETYMNAREMADLKIDSAWNIVKKAQKAFADKNHCVLDKQTETAYEKNNTTGNLYKYYKLLYLAYFKPAKQEYYIMEAMSRMDILSIKQNMDSMLIYAKESKTKLKSIGAFNENILLKNACMDLLDFCIYESEIRRAGIIDFFIKREKFESKKSSFTQQEQNDSQGKTNEYNQALAEFNEAVKSYTQISNDLNTRRNNVVSQWNNAIVSFFEKKSYKKPGNNK